MCLWKNILYLGYLWGLQPTEEDQAVTFEKNR